MLLVCNNFILLPLLCKQLFWLDVLALFVTIQTCFYRCKFNWRQIVVGWFVSRENDQLCGVSSLE